MGDDETVVDGIDTEKLYDADAADENADDGKAEAEKSDGKDAGEETSEDSKEELEGKTEDGDTDAEDHDSDTEKSDEDGAPEMYEDFVVPDGIEVDKEMLEKFTPVAKELGLTQVQAQRLVDLQSERVTEALQSQADAWQQTMDDMQSATAEDNEIGGEHYEENIALARNAVKVLGTPELASRLDATGTGNDPEFIRFFMRVGKAIGEDRLNFGNAVGAGPKDPAKVLFPNQN